MATPIKNNSNLNILEKHQKQLNEEAASIPAVALDKTNGKTMWECIENPSLPKMTSVEANSLLKTFLTYCKVYLEEDNTRKLNIYTNCLMEDILLYLVSNNSENFSWQLKDSLNEFLRANAEKGKKYMLQAGEGVRESAEMPHILGYKENMNTAKNLSTQLKDEIVSSRNHNVSSNKYANTVTRRSKLSISIEKFIAGIKDLALKATYTAHKTLELVGNTTHGVVDKVSEITKDTTQVASKHLGAVASVAKNAVVAADEAAARIVKPKGGGKARKSRRRRGSRRRSRSIFS